MKLVVGLGNPGRKYERTRHNLGFVIVDSIARQNKVTIKKQFFGALVGEWLSDGEKILLVKPQTFVNCSGESVRELMREFRVSAQALVVVYDDLDLPFGRIRIRPRGSAGGHRGVLSIMESLAGAPFYRVRVGIGRPPEVVDSADYVLEPFNCQEVVGLDEVIARASQAVISLLRDGGRRAMEQYNRAP